MLNHTFLEVFRIFNSVKALKHFSTFLLAAFLLIESIGVGLYTSVCPHSGQETTSLVIAKCCCGFSWGDKDCCDTTTELISFEFDGLIDHASPAAIGFQQLEMVKSITFSSVSILYNHVSSRFLLEKFHPPPDDDLDFQALFGVFRI